MAVEKKLELVFIPAPGMGHLPSTLQFANLLVDRHHRLSVTILVIQSPSATTTTTTKLESLCASSTTDRIKIIILPNQPLNTNELAFFKASIESQKSNIRDYVAMAVAKDPDSPTLVGLVFDMFTTTMIDVANEFGIPCYLFFTSAAASLSLAFHIQHIYHLHNANYKELLLSDYIEIPGFTNPIPSKIIPGIYFNQELAEWFHDNIRRFRETSGIIVNTFSELESQVLVNSFSEDATSRFPPLYTIGPILNLSKNSESNSTSADILKWLDEQPPSSVVFLCFGSEGSFDNEQVREIAFAIERSGYRFLWSLRKPPPGGKFEMPSEYVSFEDVLPDGFLDRTADIGRVIGWAPQVEILAHPATGGFVSHCGWNSMLESLWFGVPIGTLPLYAEQHFNAFEMIGEMGLAVEISLDCQKDFYFDNGVIVSAEKIETGIRKLMDGNSEVRRKVKIKSEESKKSMMEGGSSFTSLNRFIDHVLANFQS